MKWCEILVMSLRSDNFLLIKARWSLILQSKWKRLSNVFSLCCLVQPEDCYLLQVSSRTLGSTACLLADREVVSQMSLVCNL